MVRTVMHVVMPVRIVAPHRLQKSPNIRTVVTKTASISNQYRVFPMELLAGDADYMVTQVSGLFFFFSGMLLPNDLARYCSEGARLQISIRLF